MLRAKFCWFGEISPVNDTVSTNLYMYREVIEETANKYLCITLNKRLIFVKTNNNNKLLTKSKITYTCNFDRYGKTSKSNCGKSGADFGSVEKRAWRKLWSYRSLKFSFWTQLCVGNKIWNRLDYLWIANANRISPRGWHYNHYTVGSRMCISAKNPPKFILSWVLRGLDLKSYVHQGMYSFTEFLNDYNAGWQLLYMYVVFIEVPKQASLF